MSDLQTESALHKAEQPLPDADSQLWFPGTWTWAK